MIEQNNYALMLAKMKCFHQTLGKKVCGRGSAV